VQTLLDYLEGGDTIDEHLEGFRSVTRQQVIDFLISSKRPKTCWLNLSHEGLLSAIEFIKPGAVRFIAGR